MAARNDSKSDGGYDYAFVAPGPSNEQMCPICHLVARKACQANCCGKIFCKGCLEILRQYSDEFNCPNCRTNLNGRYFQDTRGDREICHLQIYCTNKNEGCSWQGILKDIDTHIKACRKQEVTCDKCDDVMQRHQLDLHNSDECLQRYYKCPHCEAVGIYNLMTTSHLEECPDLVLTCPNEGCEDKIKRQEMGSHHQTCLKEVIECPYQDIGCETEMKREMMDEHMETNTQAHLKNAVEKIREQRKCPVVINVSDYSKHKRDDDKWLSPGFYTSLGGYKLRLKLFANGTQNGKGTHLTCAINLMPGEYDNTLEWPFQGEVTVELLNQLKDKNHYKRVIYFDNQSNNRKKEDSIGWGHHNFIPHTDLGLNSSTNTQYLMNDTLYFRVSVNVHSKTKPWLAGII